MSRLVNKSFLRGRHDGTLPNPLLLYLEGSPFCHFTFSRLLQGGNAGVISSEFRVLHLRRNILFFWRSTEGITIPSAPLPSLFFFRGVGVHGGAGAFALVAVSGIFSGHVGFAVIVLQSAPNAVSVEGRVDGRGHLATGTVVARGGWGKGGERKGSGPSCCVTVRTFFTVFLDFMIVPVQSSWETRLKFRQKKK